LKFLQTTSSHDLLIALRCSGDPSNRSAPALIVVDENGRIASEAIARELSRSFCHLRGNCSCLCGATEHFTGRKEPHKRHRARRRDAPGGLTDEGTTRVAIFDLRAIALLGGGIDATQHRGS
jgi:hypothetical protein